MLKGARVCQLRASMKFCLHSKFDVDFHFLAACDMIILHLFWTAGNLMEGSFFPIRLGYAAVN